MRIIDKVTRVGRRDFLKTTAGAAAVAAIAPSVSSAALAKPLVTVPAAGAETLVKVARDLYPHDRIAESFYQKAIATIDEDVAAGDTPTLLSDGIAALDTAAVKLKGKSYVAIAEEQDRVAVLKTIEGSPFFTKMRSSMITALYNQQDLWMKLGYEGPSFDKGGYIERGFNDIDWL
ncbi:MAG TPA: twin-arginine translocation signal domain-containing protein [Hyphomicrobium sp.]|nr:twin-arginine translocation signal domain-containing protein [Hyphomicrobium sp.]